MCHKRTTFIFFLEPPLVFMYAIVHVATSYTIVVGGGGGGGGGRTRMAATIYEGS